ncbi:TetR/AcrR family transcriptional regulator [Oerskovia sp. NPDC056781]|uniref:TetR/AcrR family transcriptional regulator n=1 Tax=Oerskovia sp. NPDC056781 TaxID=3345942 RepID=UPI0036735634
MNRMSIEERRAQIVDAAMSIAVRDGVEAVTVRGVAAEAGISLGTVHYCFEDKDAMLRAMGHNVAVVASDPVRMAMDPTKDVRTIAHAAADGLWEGLTPRRHMRLLTFEFATAGSRNRALRPVAKAHLEQTWAMTQGILDQLAEIAGITYSMDTPFLARIVAGYIDGIEIAWLVQQDDEAAIRSFHALADYVLSLVVHPDGAVPGAGPDDVGPDAVAPPAP